MALRELIHEYLQKFDETSARKQYERVDGLMQSYTASVSQLPSPEYEIARELETISKAPCGKGVTMWIIAAQLRPSLIYLEHLWNILEQDMDCIWHEGIVDILYDLPDERSIPSLEKALHYEHADDPTGELAIKILDTLAEIGTSEAIGIVKRYLHSPSERLREVAEVLIEEIDEQ